MPLGLIPPTIAPAIVIAWLARRCKPNYSTKELRLFSCFALSAALALPTGFAECLITIAFPVLDTPITNYLVVIPLFEECCKLFALRYGIKRLTIRNAYDLILLALFSHLGFATFENSIFVSDTQTLTTCVIRAYMAVPMHAAYGVAMGWFLWKSIERENDAYLLPALSMPMLLHAIMDLSITFKIYAVCLPLPTLCIVAMKHIVSRIAAKAEPFCKAIAPEQTDANGPRHLEPAPSAATPGTC